jgi:hypothetical protein
VCVVRVVCFVFCVVLHAGVLCSVPLGCFCGGSSSSADVGVYGGASVLSRLSFFPRGHFELIGLRASVCACLRARICVRVVCVCVRVCVLVPSRLFFFVV